MRFAPMMRNERALGLFDDVFSTPFFTSDSLMKTDITEKDGIYTLKTELPGYSREDVKMSLYNGTLTIEASRNHTDEEKNEEGRVIRSERYMGSCTRSFYVGKQVKEEDINASFKDGILSITVAKKDEQRNDKQYITID